MYNLNNSHTNTNSYVHIHVVYETFAYECVQECVYVKGSGVLFDSNSRIYILNEVPSHLTLDNMAHVLFM